MPSRSPRDININVSVTNRKAADNPLQLVQKVFAFAVSSTVYAVAMPTPIKPMSCLQELQVETVFGVLREP